MSVSRSSLASALFLSFTIFAEARVAQHRVDSANRNDLKEEKPAQDALGRWSLGQGFQKRQELECPTDDLYIEMLDADDTRAQAFCNKWLDLPPATVTVDYTPTIYITQNGTRTRTQTSTTRMVMTETVIETSIVTPAPVVRRAANVAVKIAIANDVISSVISSGAVSSAPSPTNGRTEAEMGLDNACSCKNVDPTSTNTATYTAPTVVYTATINALAIPEEPETTEPLIIHVASASGLPNLPANSTAPASITGAPSVTLISTGSVAPTALPSGPLVPVVIGIPFSCPAANTANPHFIVGDLQYEYSVLCDKGIVTSTTIATIQNVANETACAAECSLLNNAAQKDLCQAAQFTRVPGASSGSCLISGPTQHMVDQSGSVAIVLTGISSKADNCASVDLADGSSNVTINTAALVASITSADFSLSTPGLQTKSEGGGEYRTMYSSGFTDSSGWYHYSWYEIYESSSAWWAVYATSWSCTTNIPRTIIQQIPAANVTSIFEDITTIINKGVTTVISGNSTSSLTNGGGLVPPTPVLASTTGGSAAFTTGFATATSNATAGGSLQGPVPTQVVSGVLVSQIGVNGTYLLPLGTETQGSAALTISGETATAGSSGSAGLIPPPPGTIGQPALSGLVGSNLTVALGGTAVVTISGATSLSGLTGGAGLLGPSVISGAAQVTVSGQIFTGASVGSAGVIPPSPTNGIVVGSMSSVLVSLNATTSGGSEGLFATSGDATFATSWSTATSQATGGDGGYGPETGPVISGAAPTSLFNSTEIAYSLLSAPATVAGSIVLSLSGATATVNSTFGAGIQPPSASPNGTTVSMGSVLSGGAQLTSAGVTSIAMSTGGAGSQGPVPITLNGTQVPSATSGAFAETESGGFKIANSTGGEGLVPPSPTNGIALSTGTGAPSLSLNQTLPFTSSAAGTESLILSSGTAFTSVTQVSGLIAPSANASGPTLSSPTGIDSALIGTAVFTTSGATSAFAATGSAGAIPPSPANVSGISPASLRPTSDLNSSLPASAGTAVFSTAGSIAVVSNIGSSAAIPPLSANVTGTASPALPPVVSLNSLTAGTEVFFTSGATAFSSAAASSGVIPPVPANASETASASLPTVPSVNSSLLAGTAVFSSSGETILASIAGSSGAVPPPSANISTTTPTSLTPSSILNSVVSAGTAIFFTSSGTAVSSIASGNGAFPPTMNSTIVAIPSSAPSLSVNASATLLGSSSPASGALSVLVSGGTAISLATGASGAIPPLPVNSTLTAPVSFTPSPSSNVSSSTRGIFSQNQDNRNGGPRRTSSSTAPVGTGAPLVVLNSTAPLGTATALNSTAPVGTGSSLLVILNSTIAPVTEISESTPWGGYGPPPTPTPSIALNQTTSISTGQPSATLPPGSVISSATVPMVNSTGTYSQDDADRFGRGRSRSSGTVPIGTAPPVIASSLIPTGSANFSVSIQLSTGAPVPASSGIVPVGTGSSSVLVPSSNVTLATGTLSSVPSSNSTIPGTGSSFIPAPSANSSATEEEESSGFTIAVANGSAVATPLVTAPFLTGSSAAPLPSANVSFTAGPRLGSQLSSAGTSTAVIPTSPASVTAPPMLANSTIASGTALVVLVSTVSVSLPQLSANSSTLLSTGARPSSVVPVLSANSSSAIGTASEIMPTPSANASVPLSSGPLGSISVSLATANASSAFGTSASAAPTSPANITAPYSTGGTASVAVPTVGANSTRPVGTGSSAVPNISANSTRVAQTPNLRGPNSQVSISSAVANRPVGTVSSAVPVQSANSSGIFVTRGTAVSSLIALTPANITGLFPTATYASAGSTGIPVPSANISLPAGTGSSSIPVVSANSSAVLSTGILVASTGVAPVLTTNSSGLLPTGSSVASTGVASILVANSTAFFVTGTSATGGSTGVPVPSSNATFPPLIGSSVPSATPTLFLNSSSEACPTTASYSTIARTAVITTTYYETVPVGPSTCLPTAASSAVPLPSLYASSEAEATSEAPAPFNRYRRSGEIATQEQIDAACADTKNLVLNPDFDLNTLAWDVKADDAFIELRTVPSGNNNSNTNNAAEILAAAPGRSLVLSQPLTLCPGKQYKLDSWNRQGNLLAKCTIQYLIGDQVVYTASPQEVFLRREELFTAGSSKDDVSKDLRIRATCAGEAGTLAGANEEGYMIVEADDVRVTQV